MTRKNKKGALLTLATIILFILMLAELLTYVLINISYDQLSASGSAAFTSASFINFIGGGSSSFIASSLNNALGALTTYESTPSLRNYHFVNSTSYALSSLMTNGTVYGANMISYMGGATLNNYVYTLQSWAAAQGGRLTLSNLTITIYQTQPLYIDARLTGLAILNSSSGTTVYPISSVANVSINGTEDLSEVQAGNPVIVKGGQEPLAILIGNVLALSGSTSPFLFAYGHAVYIGGSPSCSGIPTKFQTSSYILVTPNAGNLASPGICGMAGLVTNNTGGLVPNRPYLVYSANVVTPYVIQNGTSLLLNGAGLALLDISGLQTAIRNDYYYGSSYAPTYLQSTKGSITQGSGAGLFSFSLLDRETASFAPSASSNITEPNAIASNSFTITMWVKPSTSGSTLTVFNSVGSVGIALGLFGGSARMPVLLSVGGTQTEFSANAVVVDANAWNFVAATFSRGTASVYVGLDGNVSEGISGGPYSLTSLQLGGAASGWSAFSGNMSNVQVYGSALTPGQIAKIYLNGLNGPAIQNSSLDAWYPLNGNSSDYSGNGNNGRSSNIIYYRVAGYTADPIFNNLPNTYNTSVVKGVLNCASLSQCASTSQRHLYLGSRSLGVYNGTAQSEAGALGIANGILPNGIEFAGNGAQVRTSSGYNSLTGFSIGFWVYPSGPSGSAGSIFSSYPSYLWGMGFAGGTQDLQGYCGSDTLFTTSSQLALDSWHYVTMTCQDSGGSILYSVYINGSMAASGSVSGSIQNVGSLIFGNATMFGGTLSDVQLYNGVLSSAQAAQLYLNSSVIGMQPVGDWPFFSGYGGLANQTPDISGGNTGLFYTGNQICTSANVVKNQCGAYITQT